MKRKEGAVPDGSGAPPNFEGMMERLQNLVGTLEQGNLSLEDSIKSFEEGVALVKRCTEILDQAEQRIQKLTRDAEGNPVAAPVDEDEEPDEGRGDELPF